MLVIDDVLFSPVSGIFWIFRKLHDAALQELDAQADTITAELRELHMMLESGSISTAEFDVREKELLDRLEDLEQQTVDTEDEE